MWVCLYSFQARERTTNDPWWVLAGDFTETRWIAWCLLTPADAPITSKEALERCVKDHLYIVKLAQKDAWRGIGIRRALGEPSDIWKGCCELSTVVLCLKETCDIRLDCVCISFCDLHDLFCIDLCHDCLRSKRYLQVWNEKLFIL